jgi:hypothetical protein
VLSMRSRWYGAPRTLANLSMAELAGWPLVGWPPALASLLASLLPPG